MAIGERIHFFRTMRGMTQKYLGMALGFPEKSADVRLAQYENGSRTPKADVTAALAQALDVSPKALDVPDIDSYTGLMHTLFTLEDRYGLEVCECEDYRHRAQLFHLRKELRYQLLMRYALAYTSQFVLQCLLRHQWFLHESILLPETAGHKNGQLSQPLL